MEMEITNLNVQVKKKTETETENEETEKYITKLTKDGMTISIVSDNPIDLRAGDCVSLTMKSSQKTLTEATE